MIGGGCGGVSGNVDERPVVPADARLPARDGSQSTLNAGAVPAVTRLAGTPAVDAASDEEGGATVLLVEDDLPFAAMLAHTLEGDGLYCEIAISAEAALEQLSSEHFDLVILDIGLPGMSGFDMCREVRRRSDIPVMFLTGADDVEERLAGFDLGGDDYVVKPASLDEVVRRSRALLKRWRRGMPVDELHGPSHVVLRREAHEVEVAGRIVDLTPKEFALLAFLLERRQQVLNADTIARTVWGYETFGERNFVERHVAALRKKLSAAGAQNVVVTVRGIGYVVR